MAYKYGVILSGQAKLGFNACAFATRDEADAAGRELLSRWFVPTGYEVIETDEEANYEMVNGQPLRLED